MGTNSSSFGTPLLRLGLEVMLATSLEWELGSILLSMSLWSEIIDVQEVDA